jgi:dihydroorotase
MHKLLFLIVPILSAQTPYDLLLKGGQVIDAKNHLSAARDIAIAHGQIAAIGENIPREQARKTVDVSGLYVMPGLVDMHEHVFAASMNREYTCAPMVIHFEAVSLLLWMQAVLAGEI